MLAGASPVVASAAAPSLTGAVASIRAVPTAGTADQMLGVVVDPLFDESVHSASVDGGSSDDVGSTQYTSLQSRHPTGGDIIGGIKTTSVVTASADDGGVAMSPLGQSTLTVDFSVDTPTRVFIAGDLAASASGAAPTCSQVSFDLTPGGPSFASGVGPGPGCAGGSAVAISQAVTLAPGSYTIHLDASVRAIADQPAGFVHANGSASWNLEVALCPNTFTSGHDVIHGTPAVDVLCGGGGRDTIFGDAGNDIIFGGGSKDTLNGGPGVDSIDGGGGGDVIRGGTEPDDLWGQEGDDRVDGGTDDSPDSLYGGAGSDHIIGGGGNDKIDGASPLGEGGDLDDTIEGGSGNDRILGDRGGDTVTGGPGEDLIVGGRNGDTLRGGPGSDTVRGEGGNDELVGNQQEDVLDAGGGNDFLNACDGLRDVVVGGPGPKDRARADGVDQVFGSTEKSERCGSSRRRL